MEYIYENIKINIEVSGDGYPLIILHGWGTGAEVMAPVAKHFSENFKVYNFDLPGFGKSEMPKEVWGTKEYANMVANFIKENNLEKPIILAHSFGGRLAIHLGNMGIVGKMIITGGAGIKPKRGMDYYVKVYTYKLGKKVAKLPMFKNKQEEIKARQQKAGSSDYQNAEGIMKNIFVKVVNEDLTSLLSSIKSSTLLFWGEQDTATPLADGEKMEKLIPDAGLVKVGGTHYAFLERLDYFLVVCDSFLGKEAKANVR